MKIGAGATGLLLLGTAVIAAAAPSEGSAAALSTATPGVSAGPAAQETATADILVSITDEGGAAVADQEVFVLISDGQDVVEQLDGTTDADGALRFDGVTVAAGFTARAVALFEGYPYQGDATPLTPGQLATLPLTVFNAETGNDSNVHINVLHLILNTVEPGLYQGLQVIEVLNVGELASFRDEEFEGRQVGLAIPLPTGVAGVSPVPQISGLDPSAIAVDGDRLLVLRPLPPGTHQYAIQYELAAGTRGSDVAMTLPYPTAEVSMLAGPGVGTVEISSDQLTELDPVEIPGQGQYSNWRSDVLAAGDTLQFRVGPPQPGMTVASWSLLALAVALFGSAAASIWGGRSIADPAERQELLGRVARLDEAYASGAVDQADYYAQRGEAIGRILQLEAAMGVTPGSAGE